jgi:hypothetical protein
LVIELNSDLEEIWEDGEGILGSSTGLGRVETVEDTLSAADVYVRMEKRQMTRESTVLKDHNEKSLTRVSCFRTSSNTTVFTTSTMVSGVGSKTAMSAMLCASPPEFTALTMNRPDMFSSAKKKIVKILTPKS